MDVVTGSPSPASLRPPSSIPSRDDCWSEDATFTLIDAWGGRYLDLNRGNLRQKHWKEVANAVNDRHFSGTGGSSAGIVPGGGKPQPFRTDVQCKNRIDTLKKKYKTERGRVSESNGDYISPWPFFSAVDDLLRENFPTSGTPDLGENSHRVTFPSAITPFPVAPRSAIPRRPAPAPALLSVAGEDSSSYRGNLSAFAAAAAAAAWPASEDDSEGSRSRSSGQSGGSRKRGREGERIEGYKEVVSAIERLSQIYERVEERKRREMVELEKQRMRFAKELECHRMQLFIEMQVHLHKLNRVAGSKGSSSSVAAASALDFGSMELPNYF